MSDNTDKFDPVPAPDPSVPRNNAIPGGFSFLGPDGRVSTNIPLDANYQARFSKTIGAGDLGAYNLRARYTGDRDWKSTRLNSSH